MYVVCLLFYAIGGFCLFLYFYLFTAFYAVGEHSSGILCRSTYFI